MNALSSECSSGCESGWTLYFEHSSSSDAVVRIEDCALPGGEPKKGGFGRKGFEREDDEEEEDLSMVSDASSGPPLHYEAVEDDEAPHLSIRSKQTNSKRRKMIKRGQDQDLHSMLDDTASSPAMTNHCAWQAGVGVQEGRRSAYQEHYDGFLHSPITGHRHDNNQLSIFPSETKIEFDNGV